MENYLFSIAQIRTLEKNAINQCDISEFTLMQRAGKAAFQYLTTKWPKIQNIVIFCGEGNNGGDGLVLAKLAHQNEYKVTVRYVGDSEKFSALTKMAYKDCETIGIAISPFDPDEHFEKAILVDALLGIGLNRELSGRYQDAVISINQANLPVLAIDIPSGVNADTGGIYGEAVKAAVTVTFIGLKKGLLTGSAVDYCGTVILDKLNLPLALYEEIYPKVQKLDQALIKTLLPKRRLNTHKGNYGHVLILGGNRGMSGAVRLAGEACLRVGSGLVTVVTHPENVGLVNVRYPEMMCFSADNKQQLATLLQRVSAIVIGPGLGQDDWAQELLSLALNSEAPKIIDADALNLMGQLPSCQENWILTPHPGEAARLLKLDSAQQVQQDRYQAAAKLARLGGTWILKGAGTLIQHQDDCWVCPYGNPGMASGGMGDALSGVLAGLVAQNLTVTEAACAGVLIHGLAGDAAAVNGERGLLASDLIDMVRFVVNR